jgi:hypothetical protein
MCPNVSFKPPAIAGGFFVATSRNSREGESPLAIVETRMMVGI